MADLEVNKLTADSARVTDLTAGNIAVTGAARFASGFYGTPKDGENLNEVNANTSVSESWYVIMSNGTNIIRVKFSDFCNAILSKAGITTGKTYLTSD